MLDAIKGSGAPVVTVEAIKKDSDKVAFVNAEFRRARRRIDASGVRALVEALGNDLRSWRPPAASSSRTPTAP